MYFVALGLGCGDVAQAVVEVVETILLLDLHIAQIAFIIRQFAALADGDNGLHLRL